MIILTNPAITLFKPKRVSSTVKFSTLEWCLAEVEDDFDLTEEQMITAGIDFWWGVIHSQLDASEYQERKYQGGLPEGVSDQLEVSKEMNIAYGIYSIASNRKSDVFAIWERAISISEKNRINP